MDTMRSVQERSFVVPTACARIPAMPALRARSVGSDSVADAAAPNPTTSVNAYGIRNKKTRNASAPARTTPPVAVSRS